MNRLHSLILLLLVTMFSTSVFAQHALQVDDGLNHYITIKAPPGLTTSYEWLLPPNPPPTNTAFTQGGTLEGQTLRWNNTLGYYVPTSALLIQSTGAMTINPGEGNNLSLLNIPTDNSADMFITVDVSNRVRLRTLGSILGVTANEGLVYDEPNIKLGAANVTTNPFTTNRFVNLDNHSLTFTDANGTSTLLGLDGIGNQLISGVNVVPNSNNLYTLGTVSSRWKDMYLGPNSLYIGDGAADQVKLGYNDVSATAQKLTIDADDNGTDDATIDESGRLAVRSGLESIGNTDLVFRTNGVIRARLIRETDAADEGAFVPEENSVYDLGTPELRWRDVYVSEGSLRIGKFVSGTKGTQSQQMVEEVTLSYDDQNDALFIDKPIAGAGSILPDVNNQLELGSSSARWAELWLGPNSLHIGSPSYEGSISFDPTSSEFRFNSNNTVGSSEMILNGSGNLILSGLAVGGLLKANVGGQLAIATGGVDFESPLTFSNGLTRTSNAVALGGALTGVTDIPLGVNNLTFSGTGGGRVGIGTTGVPAALLSVGAASPFQVNTSGAIAAATGITSSGTITFSGLATGVVHSTAGVLSSSAVVSGDIQDGTVADADLRNSAALSVIGRSANSVGAPADITAGTDGHVLRRSGTTLGFGTIATSGITAGANNTFLVTNNSGIVAWSGLNANATNLSGNGIGTALNVVTGDLTSSTAALVVSTGTARLVGGNASLSLTTGDLTSSDITVGTGTGRLVGGGATLTIANDAVTFAKMQNITSSRLIGRTTASAGDAEEISVNSTLTLSTLTLGLNLGNTNTWTAAQTFSSGVSVSGGLTIPAGTNPMSVNGSNGAIDQVLTSQATNSPQWKSLSTLGVTTGSGTANSIAMWSSSTALGNAPMTVSTGNVSFTGTIAAATGITSSGTITFSGLNTGGIVKATATTGVLALAVAGTDYQTPLTFSNGITNTSGAIKLGGALTAATDIPLSTFDLSFSGSSGNVYIGQTSGAARLDVLSTSATTSLKAVASGASAGKAADFSNDNASNSSDLLTATNAGSGWTGKFDGTGTNSKGIYVNAGQDKKGLQVNRGSVILSHTNDAASNNINPNGDLNSVHAVDDDGAAGGSTFKLPVGTNGQILYIFNGDTNGNLTIQQNLHTNNTGPTAITPGNTVVCIYVTNSQGSGWVTK